MRILYRVLILLLLLISFCYGIYNITHVDDSSKNQIPIAPVLDKRRYALKLYFANLQNSGLAVENRIIISSEQMEEKVVVEELIKGPRNKMLKSYIPKQTKMISVNTVDGICYVNFSKEIVSDSWGEISEDMMIWSIVNSITEIDYIDAVQILVDGNKDIFEKVYALKEPLYRNEQLIKKEISEPIDAFNQFLDYLKSANYKNAYEMLDQSSMDKFDFLKFKLIISSYAQEIKNYEIHMYQTQKFKSGMVLIIHYKKSAEAISNLEEEMIEKWKFVYENGLWKIVLPS